MSEVFAAKTIEGLPVCPGQATPGFYQALVFVTFACRWVSRGIRHAGSARVILQPAVFVMPEQAVLKGQSIE